jgi:hypothetical protein
VACLQRNRPEKTQKHVRLDDIYLMCDYFKRILAPPLILIRILTLPLIGFGNVSVCSKFDLTRLACE